MSKLWKFLSASLTEEKLIGVGLVGIGGFDAGAGDESAKSIFATGAALGSDNEAVAVDDDVNGIGVGLVHGGEIGVFHHDDLAVARMLLEIFFDGFPGFADVDSEEDEAFAGEFMADLVDEGGFVSTEAAPSGPEFEEDDFAFDGVVSELFAGGSDGVEVRGGLFVLGHGERANGHKKQDGENCRAQREVFRCHEGNVYRWEKYVSITLLAEYKEGPMDGGSVKITERKWE